VDGRKAAGEQQTVKYRVGYETDLWTARESLGSFGKQQQQKRQQEQQLARGIERERFDDRMGKLDPAGRRRPRRQR
jgi:hypothetical protein